MMALGLFGFCPGVALAQTPTDVSPVSRGEGAAPEPRVPLAQVVVDWRHTPALQLIRSAWDNARLTAYDATTRVDEAVGKYTFDCSGFSQWVLKQSHPQAARWVASGLPHRPLARNFQSRIATITAKRPRYGWARVERVEDIQPGDVIAWIKPREIHSKNTGHVVFAVLPPRRLTANDNTYLVRVADSTRLWHADDTRNWQGDAATRREPLGLDTWDESPNDQGLGFGTISLIADPATGAPVEYGWAATLWRTFATRIAIGRPLK